MKAKHLVSMLLAGSMILGLAACAPTTNSCLLYTSNQRLP